MRVCVCCWVDFVEEFWQSNNEGANCHDTSCRNLFAAP